MAIGSSTDSIVIGYDIWEALAGYPYPFKGAIDDIRLYNRVLSDFEISLYTGSTVDIPGTVNNEPEITISPNPAHNNITITVPGNTNTKVQILNSLGQQIIEQHASAKQTNIDISNIPAGMYIVKMQVGEQTFFKKFVKE